MPRKTLRDRLYPEEEARDRIELSPSVEPGNGFLGHSRDVLNKRRVPWKRMWSKILRHVPPHDAAAVQSCGEDLARFHNPKTGLDVFFAKLCHNYYCPTCPHYAHYTRTYYHARKIASLDPTHEKPVPKVVNLVFTLPPALHAWARIDPRFMPAWRKAIMRTIGEAYGYEGTRGCPVDRTAFKELGAIMNLHAIGDEAKPWPKWAPHMDIIMPAWKRTDGKIEPLRTTWPERFKATNRRYREKLQELLMPIAKKPDYRLDVVEFLKTDFDTVWHLSRPPKTPTNPERKSIIHVESAMHRIRYSCRPLFTLAQARHYEEEGKEWLWYEIPQGTRRRVTHHVPLLPALGQLESIRQWMTGRMARTQVGILSKRSYDATVKLAGHEPVRERASRGLIHKATYELGENWQYSKTTRAPWGRPREEEDGPDSE